MDLDLRMNAEEIMQPAEALAAIEPPTEYEGSSLATIYRNAFHIGSPLYQGISQSIRGYLAPEQDVAGPDTRKDLERGLRYLGLLKKTFNKLASAENENTFREILREHRNAQPSGRSCNIPAFVFVQQLLGYVWEVYPFIDEDPSDNFCKELQTLFQRQIENDPQIYVIFHITMVMMCPYILGLYESESEKRTKIRELLRVFVTTEEAKKNERYYDLISAIVYFFLILHACTGKRYEYVLVQVILDRVRDVNISEDISKAHVFHIEAVLQGLLKALHKFNSGVVKSTVFAKEKPSLSLNTWNQITKFADDVDRKYRPKEFFGLRRYCKEQPQYVAKA